MKRRKRLGRGVAVVGAGMSKFGMYKDKNSKDVFAEAFNEMLASVDKGIDPNDIQAMYLGNFSNDFFVNQAHWGPVMSDLVGMMPKPATRTEGRAPPARWPSARASSPIASGFYDIVLVGGFRRHVQAHHRGGHRRSGHGLGPVREEMGFTFPGVFAAGGHRLFRQVRGQPRGPDEHHHQEPQQRAA